MPLCMCVCEKHEQILQIFCCCCCFVCCTCILGGRVVLVLPTFKMPLPGAGVPLMPLSRRLSTPPSVSGLKLCWNASRTLPRPRPRPNPCLLRPIITSIMATSSMIIVASTVIMTLTKLASVSVVSTGRGEITDRCTRKGQKERKEKEETVSRVTATCCTISGNIWANNNTEKATK